MTMDIWRPRRLPRPWSPFRGLEEMELLLEAPFAGWPSRLMWRRIPAMEMAWAPSVEMYEKEDSFTVKAELPGVKEEDNDISIVGDTLTIRGERRAESEVKEEDYYFCESSYGSFSRSIPIPATVDTAKIEASFEDGILEVRLPKAKEIKPAKVQIKPKEAKPARAQMKAKEAKTAKTKKKTK